MTDVTKVKTVVVKVNWQGGSKFSYSENRIKIPAGTGVIVLKPKHKRPNFTFLGITIRDVTDPTPISCDDAYSFSHVATDFQVTGNQDAITILDTNPGGTKTDYHFRIGILGDDGNRYCSDPEIINRAD